jgi:hypothetical protein
VYFTGLRRQEDLAWLHAYIDALDAAETKVGAWAVQHNGAACVDHVCLEQHFVDVTIVIDDVEFGGRKVQAPVAKVAVDDVNGVVFKGGVEARAFKDFAEDADGVDEVGEGTEDGERGEEGGIVVVLESMGIGNLLGVVSIVL